MSTQELINFIAIPRVHDWMHYKINNTIRDLYTNRPVTYIPVLEKRKEKTEQKFHVLVLQKMNEMISTSISKNNTMQDLKDKVLQNVEEDMPKT